MQKKIGIIGAMDIEVEALVKEMQAVHKVERAGMSFHEGILYGLQVVVAQCGIGKVNAGICAQIMISEFHATHLINTGVAGSLDPSLDIGDIVVSVDAVQHDYDISDLGFHKGEIPYTGLYACPADRTLRTLAVDAASKAAPEIRIVEGRVCSGYQFIASDASKITIIRNFGGLCCEMEGAAIAQVCYLNQIPFVVIRAISDKSNSDSTISFDQFKAEAASHSTATVRHMLHASADI